MVWGYVLKIFGVFGTGLSSFIVFYKVIKDIPFIWKIATNFGTIKGIYQKLYEAGSHAVRQGHPSFNDVNLCMQAFEDALKSGLIDIPNVDENELYYTIYDLRNKLINAVKDKTYVEAVNVKKEEVSNELK